jgi:predicted NACHT family NTPase
MTKKPGIRINPEHIQIVKKARDRLFFRQQDLADKLGIARTTVQAFLRGDRVSRINFEEICLALQLNWEEIADLPTFLHRENNDNPEAEIDALVKKVRQHCSEKIKTLYGQVKPLDISRPIDLEDLYVDVDVIELLTSCKWVNFFDLSIALNSDAHRFNRLICNQHQQLLPGLVAIKKYKRLMVLGKPGAGKTTFLQYLAIQCNEGKFLEHLIPIFIRLKDFDKYTRTEWDFKLLNYICQKFEWCGITQEEITEILKHGRALILLDGLNEVTAEAQIQVVEEIQELDQNYLNNKIIITCRNVACKYMFSSFTEVELADFNHKQIKCFAENWFVAVAKNNREAGFALAEEFMEKLNEPKNQRIRELAVTPLFLHLICLVFQENAEFPPEVVKLYEEGLDILLQKWDEARGIVPDKALTRN